MLLPEEKCYCFCKSYSWEVWKLSDSSFVAWAVHIWSWTGNNISSILWSYIGAFNKSQNNLILSRKHRFYLLGFVKEWTKKELNLRKLCFPLHCPSRSHSVLLFPRNFCFQYIFWPFSFFPIFLSFIFILTCVYWVSPEFGVNQLYYHCFASWQVYENCDLIQLF